MRNKYILRYPPESVDKPVFAQVILEAGSEINILKADINYKEGELVVTIPGDGRQEKKVLNNFKRKGLTVEKLEKTLTKDEQECVDCGECTGICPTDALSLKDKKMEIDQDKCIYCELCVETCPTRALNIKGE